jgi:DNA-binding protein H-NS
MMDLSNMSLGDLRNLQEQIKQEMKQREQQLRRALAFP